MRARDSRRHHQPSRLPGHAYPAMCARREIPLAERMAEWQAGHSAPAPAASGESSQAAAPADELEDELDGDLDDVDVEEGGAIDDAELDDDDLDVPAAPVSE